MTSLVIQNIYSYLKTNDLAILKHLHHKFSFSNSCFFAGHKPSWKNDVSFFSQKNGKFPTGILSEVTNELRHQQHNFTRIDERPKLEKVPKVVTADFLKNTPAAVQLHDYQVDVANLALSERRGIVKCPTGGGKTIIFSSIIKAFDGQISTMVLVRSLTLVDQTYQVLTKAGIPNVGRLTGEHNDPCQVTVATLQSLHKLKPSKLQKIEALIVDEVHEFSTNKTATWLRQFKETIFRFGFSATPWEKNDHIHNYRLKSWIGPELCEIDITSLKNSGILSECYVQFHTVPLEGMENFSFSEVEYEGIVDNEKFHQQVVNIVNQIPEGRIIIMVHKLQHGDRLHDMIPSSYWIKGEDNVETRAYVLSLLRDTPANQKVVAIVSSIGYLGVNVYVHYLINASGGKSPLQLIQKVGRGLRKYTDKHFLLYHDFWFTGNRYLERHSKDRVKTLKQEGHQFLDFL